jgi:hypothetical protein
VRDTRRLAALENELGFLDFRLHRAEARLAALLAYLVSQKVVNEARAEWIATYQFDEKEES